MKGIKRIYFVKTLTYLILAFLFLKYYFIDVLVEYSKGSSTYSVLTQEVDKLLIPQLILCFNPLYKPSKTEEFGIKIIARCYETRAPHASVFFSKNKASKYSSF